MRGAIELARAGKGDVIEIEVEAHADRVGGDQKFDLTRLIEGHLRITRARRQRAQHHGCTAALTPDQLGDRINFRRRKSDNRRAWRKSRDLFFARVAEFRQAWPRNEICAWYQLINGIAHGLRAEQQRLFAAARVQHAVGEHMAAIEVSGELDFIDSDKVGVHVAWHGLDRAHPIAGALWLDLFFACDERNFIGANAGRDLVVDLARQQPQRQTDHSRRMPEHALNGQMRLTGICRPQNRRDISNAVSQVTAHARGLLQQEPLALHCDRLRSSHIRDN